MDLPVRRFRQITAAINRRHFLARREEVTLASWQTRTLATFIAGGYMVDSGENKAMEHAQSLAFDEIDQALVEDQQKRSADASLLPQEPREGSYERFMQSFGSPSRWAGAG